MCGIAGYHGFRNGSTFLPRMLDAIAHRGPDDEGSAEFGDTGFGMRRLSIIDLPTGSQPIWNEDRTLALVFNGEIYNHARLRAQLQSRGHTFTSQSDTETIVHLYEEFGIDALHHLRGMFTFALYDLKRRQLTVARDRVGIKPLYYWQDANLFAFASETKALLECPVISREIRPEAIDDYLTHRYSPGPDSFIQGIKKLPPGHFLTIDRSGMEIAPYWKPDFNVQLGDPQELQTQFNDLFEETISLHLESDVPVGAFLSGGLDSTAVVSAMARQTSSPVKTFSIGFDWDQDETGQARKTSERLGTEHHEITCGEADFRHLPEIIWHLDEPIGDAIVVPMHLLSSYASEQVKVVLTGEGADETLGGYAFHKFMLRSQQLSNRLPPWLIESAAPEILERTPLALLRAMFPYPGRFGSRSRTKTADYLKLLPSAGPGRQLRHLTSLFDSRDKQGLYTAHFAGSLEHFRDVREPGAASSYLNRVLSLGFDNWLPDNILMKVDKTSMASSIEARVPFMDHLLVEFLGHVPTECKIQGSTTKWLLRNYLQNHLPGGAANRAKKPFYVPVEKFCQSPVLKSLVKETLSERSVRKRGYFDYASIKTIKQQMTRDDFLYSKQVLSLVILELWHRIYIDRETGWR